MLYLQVIIFIVCYTLNIEANICHPCHQVQCDPSRSSDCVYGVVLEQCGCCDECAKGPGELCGGRYWMGKCGTGYICEYYRSKRVGEPGRCVPEP